MLATSTPARDDKWPSTVAVFNVDLAAQDTICSSRPARSRSEADRVCDRFFVFLSDRWLLFVDEGFNFGGILILPDGVEIMALLLLLLPLISAPFELDPLSTGSWYLVWDLFFVREEYGSDCDPTIA